jgi:hypothetical protein
MSTRKKSRQVTPVKPRPTCAVTILRILATVGILVGLIASGILLYSLRAFLINYDTAVEEAKGHPNFDKYIGLHLNCRQKASSLNTQNSNQYEVTTRNKCLSKQFPYIFAIAWAAFAGENKMQLIKLFKQTKPNINIVV